MSGTTRDYDTDNYNENANERVAYTRGLRHGRAAQSLGVPSLTIDQATNSAYTRGYSRGWNQARLTHKAV